MFYDIFCEDYSSSYDVKELASKETIREAYYEFQMEMQRLQFELDKDSLLMEAGIPTKTSVFGGLAIIGAILGALVAFITKIFSGKSKSTGTTGSSSSSSSRSSSSSSSSGGSGSSSSSSSGSKPKGIVIKTEDVMVDDTGWYRILSFMKHEYAGKEYVSDVKAITSIIIRQTSTELLETIAEQLEKMYSIDFSEIRQLVRMYKGQDYYGREIDDYSDKVDDEKRKELVDAATTVITSMRENIDQLKNEMVKGFRSEVDDFTEYTKCLIRLLGKDPDDRGTSIGSLDIKAVSTAMSNNEDLFDFGADFSRADTSIARFGNNNNTVSTINNKAARFKELMNYVRNNAKSSDDFYSVKKIKLAEATALEDWYNANRASMHKTCEDARTMLLGDLKGIKARQEKVAKRIKQCTDSNSTKEFDNALNKFMVMLQLDDEYGKMGEINGKYFSSYIADGSMRGFGIMETIRAYSQLCIDICKGYSNLCVTLFTSVSDIAYLNSLLYNGCAGDMRREIIKAKKR